MPISFKKACFLSMLLHGLLFVFVSTLVKFTNKPNFNDSVLIFDFASLPTSHSIHKEKEVNTVATMSGVNLKPIRNNKTKFGKIENALANQHPISEQANLRPPILTSALMPASINTPRIVLRQPKLLPTVFSMSERQQAFLSKMASKLADKLHRLKLSDTLFVWKDGKNTYQVRLHRKQATTITGLDEVVFEVETQQNGLDVCSEMRMRRFAFSNFAQFVDYWDPKVAMHDDEFSGRVHTNYNFTISRDSGIKPKFYDKVTTATFCIKSADRYPLFDLNSVFRGGIETGVTEIRVPRELVPFYNDTEISDNRVQHFTEDTWITFHKVGSFSWDNKYSPKNEYRQMIPQQDPFFIVGDNKINLHVKGIVRGKILVYSEGKIIINDDLLYACHPETAKYSDDYVGLVSQKDIEIAHPSVTGPGDLFICAAIYARGQFRVPNLWGHGEATLHIYGSLSAGSLSATEPRYATRIIFDKRLENKRPPHFPLTEHYEMVSWNRLWKVEEQ